MPDPTTPPPAATPPPFVSQQDIDSGKTMAILSYIPVAAVGLVVSIISVSQKNNAFSLYHAKQALTVYICQLAASLICLPLCFLCIGFPLIIAVSVGSLVLCVLGIVNANAGECKPLPLTGPFADKWFGKIQKI